MPKKKKSSKNSNSDFTINDCANAPKQVSRVKKAAPVETVTPELSWDQFQNEDFDIIEETNADGTRQLVYKKKQNHSKCENKIEGYPGIVYPEIVWYLISRYIKPEDVGRFAGINKVTYAITKRESFWRNLYKHFCENNRSLPERLRIENGYKSYGLRQKIIRALYHTYDIFKNWSRKSVQNSPHVLIKRCCVNVWYAKRSTYSSIYLKFKKLSQFKRKETSFIEELGRIDANPEEDCKVLEVICENFYEMPPLMGMTLSSVRLVLSYGFQHHRLHLGFNTGSHNVSRNILPESTFVIDNVVNTLVYDWWHPEYPYYETSLPCRDDVERLPVLEKDFCSDL